MSQSVILLSDVPGLGQVGDLCTVKEGYARNYLLPQHLAVLATTNIKNRVARQKDKIAATKEKQLQHAQSLADKVSKVGLVYERPVGHGGRLFGSVTSLDIVNEIAKQGATIEKKCVLMHASIKTVGDHTVRVRLHSKVFIEVPVKVVGTQGAVQDHEPSEGEKTEEAKPETEAVEEKKS